MVGRRGQGTEGWVGGATGWCHTFVNRDGEDERGTGLLDIRRTSVLDLRCAYRDEEPIVMTRAWNEGVDNMTVKGFVRELHTFQPGPFGWCCYDCNEGQARILLSRFSKG